MHQPVDLLVEAEFLYPMTQGLPVIQGGEVAIRADRIVYAGPAQPVETGKAIRKSSARGHAVCRIL